LDDKNAFLHGDIVETVYYQQPAGFVDPSCPDDVCLLRKSLYGLKQAPRAWFQCFATHLHQLGFASSKSDSFLFVYNNGADAAHLLLYVDDIVLSASSSTLLHHIIDQLRLELTSVLCISPSAFKFDARHKASLSPKPSTSTTSLTAPG